MDNAFLTLLFRFVTKLFKNGEFVFDDEGFDRAKDFRPRGVHDYHLGSGVTSDAPFNELREI